MAYCCFNGQIRPLPSIRSDCGRSYVSIVPSQLPHGLITIYEVTNEKRTLLEVHRYAGEVIIDHCWTTFQSSTEEKLLVLATLTRVRGGATEASSLNDTEIVEDCDSDHMSTLYVQWRKCSDGIGETRRNSIDNSFSCQIKMISPLNSTCIAINTKLIVIGSSMGSLFLQIHDIIATNCEDPQSHHGNGKRMAIQFETLRSQRILNSFVIHAMDLSTSYFIAVSGEQLGVWNVTEILKYFVDDDCIRRPCAAEWSIKLVAQPRVTCVRLSTTSSEAVGKYIGLSSWDGSAVIFVLSADNDEHSKAVWNRIQVPLEPNSNELSHQIKFGNPPWEKTFGKNQMLSPTFIEICECNNIEQGVFLLVSNTHPNCLRLYDVKDGSHKTIIQDRKSDGDKRVEGIATLSLQSNYSFAYVDSNDHIELFCLGSMARLPLS